MELVNKLISLQSDIPLVHLSWASAASGSLLTLDAFLPSLPRVGDGDVGHFHSDSKSEANQEAVDEMADFHFFWWRQKILPDWDEGLEWNGSFPESLPFEQLKHLHILIKKKKNSRILFREDFFSCGLLLD